MQTLRELRIDRATVRGTVSTIPASIAAIVVLAVAAPSALAATSEAPAHPIDPAMSARLEAARSLYDLRTGISEDTPNTCTTEVVSEVNPNAANQGSLEAGPPKFVVEAPTSGTWRFCFHVRNRSQDVRTLNLSTVDVFGSSDPKVTLDTSDDPKAAGSWITLAVPSVTLQPGELVRVPYVLEIPPDPPKGALAAGIRISDPPPEGDTSAVTRSLVVQLGLEFPGGVARKPVVEDIESTRFIWSDRSPNVTRATFTIRNDGTVIDTVTPAMRIDGLFGIEVGATSTTPEVLLPEGAYRTSLRWSDVPFAGVYRPTLTIRSQHGDRTIELPRVYVLPPWPWLVVIGLSVAVFVFGFIRSRRAQWKQYLDEEYDVDDEYDEGDPQFEN